jgi:hypothetical protein
MSYSKSCSLVRFQSVDLFTDTSIRSLVNAGSHHPQYSPEALLLTKWDLAKHCR